MAGTLYFDIRGKKLQLQREQEKLAEKIVREARVLAHAANIPMPKRTTTGGAYDAYVSVSFSTNDQKRMIEVAAHLLGLKLYS